MRKTLEYADLIIIIIILFLGIPIIHLDNCVLNVIVRISY